METLTIELTNEKAHGLLEELENLEIIRIVKDPVFESRSSRYMGKLNDESANSLREYVATTRLEWEERFPTQ